VLRVPCRLATVKHRLIHVEALRSCLTWRRYRFRTRRAESRGFLVRILGVSTTLMNSFLQTLISPTSAVTLRYVAPFATGAKVARKLLVAVPITFSTFRFACQRTFPTGTERPV